MAAQYSAGARNAWVDAIVASIGAAPTLEIRTGSAPANYAASATGTLLASMALPSSWMGAASGGAASLAGTWQDTSANATGTAGYFRIIGATNGMQGVITATGGGGDMTLDSVAITTSQTVNITAFTITAGGA